MWVCGEGEEGEGDGKGHMKEGNMTGGLVQADVDAM